MVCGSLPFYFTKYASPQTKRSTEKFRTILHLNTQTYKEKEKRLEQDREEKVFEILIYY